VSYAQNWDSVIAPTIPTNWTVGADIVTTSTLTGGMTPTSAPNVLTKQSQLISSTPEFAIYGTADSAAGNLTVQANFGAGTLGAIDLGGLVARSSSLSNLLGAGASYYWVELGLSGGTLQLFSVVNGTPMSLAGVSAIPTSAAIWYQLAATFAGSTITITCQNLSNGGWLTSSGTFVSSPTAAISTSDNSISGAGYFGLSITSKAGTVYSDDFAETESIAPLSTPYPWNYPRPFQRPLSRRDLQERYG
jgi:hypothetical protein